MMMRELRSIKSIRWIFLIFVLHIQVPAGSFATVEIPTSTADSVKENGKVISQANGVIKSHASDRGVICVLASGDYAFTSDL